MGVRTKAIGVFLLGLFSAWAWTQAGPSQTKIKGDQETIRAAVEKHGFYERGSPNREYLRERDHVEFSGCTMIVHVLTVGADEPPYKRETLRFDAWIDLKKMDPIAIASLKDLNGNTLPDNKEWLILKTADGQEWIQMKRGGKMVNASSAWLLPGSANHEENQRVVAAFEGVVAACKGQK